LVAGCVEKTIIPRLIGLTSAKSIPEGAPDLRDQILAIPGGIMVTYPVPHPFFMGLAEKTFDR
jgi:hypothetical protein